MKKFINLLAAIVLFFNVLIVNMPAYAANDYPFEDVTQDAWYRDDVVSVYNAGLFSGTSETTFSPDDTLSLSQAVALAVRLNQYSKANKAMFDSGNDTWYAPYVTYAKQNKMIGNDYDGRWEDAATRTEMVKILYKALDSNKYPAINKVDDNAIPDVKKGWQADNEIYTFYRAGILTGDDSHFFNAENSIQRAEVAAILNRMINPAIRQHVTLILPTLPDSNEPATDENVLATLDRLDPDGAYIIRCESDAVSWGNYVSAFGSTMNDVSDGISTAVHETCHLYTDLESEFDSENKCFIIRNRFYIGNGENIVVTQTNVFDSQEMINTIPKSLQTFRFVYLGGSYNTNGGDFVYGADTSGNSFDIENLLPENISSRKSGIYGLLNEFTAYCWGTNTTLKLYDENQHMTNAHGYNYIKYMTNDWTAYAEFRYYILHYMLYAKEHYPKIYQDILNNDEFRKAFSKVESKYASVVEELRKKAGRYFESKNKIEYDVLMKEMEKPEYQEMFQLLQP